MDKVVEICGDIFYLKDGLLHNEDGPSIVYANGVEWWMINGKLHRDNGPAVIDKNEIIGYWIDGEPATEEEIKNINRNKWIDRTYENRRKETK